MMKRFTKVLSLVMAVVFAVSAFTITSEAKMTDAMQTKMQAHQRQLTYDEIRAIYPAFNYKEYAAMYPDLKEAFGEDEVALYTHFVTCGIWEERQPNAVFNVDAYATLNYDLRAAFGDDIVSYYIYYASHQWESGRVAPTLSNCLWRNLNVYSVYDFQKGTYDPVKGVAPICNRAYHPGINWP
ncbi:MAG: hypothetical protein IKP29_03630 [Pseudobutyrivibrio sp.]|nr:hypothetical protein [Pseudobutyrivibrio sp.]